MTPTNLSIIGFIQTQDNKVFQLFDKKNELEDTEYMILSPEEWYGVLYYDMYAYQVEGNTYYSLFGFHGDGKYQSKKVVDVLYFDNGIPVFGVEHFVYENDGARPIEKNRVIITYSAESNTSLKYNPGLEMITHDHLIERLGNMPGQGPTFLPDGSYVGYVFKEDRWRFVEKIFNHKYEKAPMEDPSSEFKTNDVFKRKRGKKKRVK